MSAAAALKVGPHDRPLSSSTPHLMPFHISYSGPAPISTYFRIKPTSPPTYGRDERPLPTLLPLSESQESTDSQTTLVAGSSANPSSSSIATLVSSSTLMDVDVDDQDASRDASTRPPNANSSHFAASFRGRAMHGAEVNLPEGYAGIVLRAPSDDAKGKRAASGVEAREEDRKPKSKSKGRTTRQSKRAPEPELVEAEDEHEGGDGSTHLEENAARVLQPVSTFSSFVLWHPDVPVDEARDEYLRSLTEWTRLAAEIHRVEDC
ncbi:hypothetical protein V8D89_014856 [Ganoderma adspersum]